MPTGTCAAWCRQQPNRISLRTHPAMEPLETRVCPATMTGSNWMSFVPPNTSLFQMSLPGTHDSLSGSAPFTDADLATLVNNAINNFLNNLANGIVNAVVPQPFQGAADGLVDPVLDTLADATINLAADTVILNGSPIITPNLQLFSQTQFSSSGVSDALTSQLDSGVRVLDIRVQEVDNALYLVHGSLPLGTPQETFASVLPPVVAFLQANPGETVVMQVQDDSDDGGGNTPGNFDQVFHQEIAPYSSNIWNPALNLNSDNEPEPVPPTLGQAGGNIVFIQSNWSTPDPLYPDSYKGAPTGQIAIPISTPQDGSQSGDIFSPIQNDFQTTNQGEKELEVAALMAWDAKQLSLNNPPPTTFSVNYLSTNDSGVGTLFNEGAFTIDDSTPYGMATGDGGTFTFSNNLGTYVGDILSGGILDSTLGPIVTWTPGGSGDGMNNFMENSINSQYQGGPSPDPLGIVFTDFASPGLIQDIYSQNPFPIFLNSNGTLTLNVNGEPAGNQPINIGLTASGGVQATVDGLTESFSPGQVTSIDVVPTPSSYNVNLTVDDSQDTESPGYSIDQSGLTIYSQSATPLAITFQDLASLTLTVPSSENYTVQLVNTANNASTPPDTVNVNPANMPTLTINPGAGTTITVKDLRAVERHLCNRFWRNHRSGPEPQSVVS